MLDLKIADAAYLEQRCADEELLHGWLESFPLLKLPRQPVCPGHCSPFEYVSRAYFDGGDLVVWAPRGGGKTRLAAALTLAEILHRPGISIRILGGSLEQSLRVWEHLLADVERLVPKHLIAGKIRARSVRLVNGSSAGVVTQSQQSVRGLRVQKLRCDEVELFDPGIWEAAQMVTRSKADDHGRLIAAGVEALSTFHARGGMMKGIVDRAVRHRVPVLKWCLMEVLEKCPAERDCETCALFEDCGRRAKVACDGFFSIDDAIAIKKRVSRETWEMEMMCRGPATKGAVFKYFDPAVHVRETLPVASVEMERRESREGLFLAIDFGYANPFVCLWVRRDAWGRSFVIDEYVQSERRMAEHIEEIKGRGHGVIKRVYCDPAGNGPNDQTGRSNVEELRKHWTVRYKGGRIQDGIELIRAALCSGVGESRLFVHPRCRRLIAAMTDYRYEEGGGERPLKDGINDHPVDALRYYFVNASVGEVVGAWY